MILSADESEILDYLKSWKGTSVPMAEISRCAGGRRKFRNTPDWAKGLMARLVEAKLIEVNDRGHYRAIIEEEVHPVAKKKARGGHKIKKSHQIDDNYFPADMAEAAADVISGVVGEDYFPSTAG